MSFIQLRQTLLTKLVSYGNEGPTILNGIFDDVEVFWFASVENCRNQMQILNWFFYPLKNCWFMSIS